MPMMNFRTVMIAVLLCMPVMSCMAQLNDEEAAMLAWIDSREPKALELIEQLVNINSGTMNHAGVRTVGGILDGELADLGFDTEWIELPEEVDRAGHLFARRNGDRGKRLLLIGHLDTVFEPDDAFQTFVRDGAHATGPGAMDMKSGDVILLYALKALSEVDALAGTQIVVAYSGDEESPGSPLAATRRDLIEAGQWAEIALGFEEATVDDQAEWAVTSRRGSSSWRLEVTGRQAHSSQIFSEQVGAGAIFEAARILADFYAEVRGEEYLTFNAGTILGGTVVDYDSVQTRGEAFGKNNVVPQRAIVQGGIRTISSQQLEWAREAMRNVVARHLPLTDASISFSDGYPAMAPTEGNLRIQEMISTINRDLGRGPMPAVDPSRRGAADISFVAPFTDGIDGLGGRGGNGHSPEEWLDLESVPLAIKRAAILIYRLSRNGN